MMVDTPELPAEWQAINDYCRAFVAERVRIKLHNQDGRWRALTQAEGEIALQAIFDLLAEQPFLVLAGRGGNGEGAG
jgi:hypothetical protein